MSPFKKKDNILREIYINVLSKREKQKVLSLSLLQRKKPVGFPMKETTNGSCQSGKDLWFFSQRKKQETLFMKKVFSLGLFAKKKNIGSFLVQENTSPIYNLMEDNTRGFLRVGIISLRRTPMKLLTFGKTNGSSKRRKSFVL